MYILYTLKYTCLKIHFLYVSYKEIRNRMLQYTYNGEGAILWIK